MTGYGEFLWNPHLRASKLMLLLGLNSLVLAYRKELQKLQDLTDSAPVNKINFLQCLITARAAITPRVVKGGWRHSGNYPINRHKALSHEEIQEDKQKRGADELEKDEKYEPISHGFITAIGRDRSYNERSKLRRVANHLEDLQAEVILLRQQNASLKAQNEAISKTRKRKKIPNPNKRFMTISEALAAGEEANLAQEEEDLPVEDVVEVQDEVDEEDSEDDNADILREDSPPIRTSSGRASRMPNRYLE
ncbi:Crypt2 [Cryphonectria parasitica EP155]|uniref:Crypt2 n=1 Tax=Cryphonectria parasitica (strain ATCC 38755 / EP155) TaxID=660469 RepID=A0A9P5CSJ9_CRYP1|nr:Crypt2 [Cryphonectria parasitica EP155]KAF3768215.1 Crypt2 [Cryphonectria parasitica EP155]